MQIRKVLMVDDDPTIRRVASISLSRIGNWEVELASSGQHALELLESSSADFDLILLDVMMPVMDGPSTLRAILNKQKSSRIPVIFMTAKVQKHEVQAYYDLGVCGVIIKPFDPVTLPAQIQKVVDDNFDKISVA